MAVDYPCISACVLHKARTVANLPRRRMVRPSRLCQSEDFPITKFKALTVSTTQPPLSTEFRIYFGAPFLSRRLFDSAGTSLI